MRHLLAWTRQHEQRLVARLRACVAGLIAVGLAVAGVPAAAVASAAASTATAAAAPRLISTRHQPDVFEGLPMPGRAGAEGSAVALVDSIGGLPVEPGTYGRWVRSGDLAVAPDRCPTADLVVSWTPPGEGYADGAYVAPLGPPPTDATERVNGVVLCRSSHQAFLGFEAAWEHGRWLLSAVPSLDESTSDPLLAGEAEAEGAAPAEVAADSADAAGPTLPPATAWVATPLEPLADYVPQTTCDPTAKPGVLGFRDLLLETFPGTRNLGIGRVCEAEGVSEHKEGRALDWGVRADDPTERADAEQVLAWLLGPDADGQPYAMARRVGLMYVIWDEHIWSSFLADEGWRPYVGRSEHRDHIHFSFSWDGALARTTFWQGGRAGVAPGSAAPDLPLAPVTTTPPMLPGFPLPAPALPLPDAFPPQPQPAPASSDSGSSPSTTTTTTTAPPSTTTTTAPPASTTTTTTTAPAPTPTLLSPPTTLKLGSL
jgi:hypothetical protein